MLKMAVNGENEPDLIDAMISLIRDPSVGGDTARLAGTIISLDANFNCRVSEQKVKGMSDEKMFELISFSEDVLNEARSIASDATSGLPEGFIQTRLSALIEKLYQHRF